LLFPEDMEIAADGVRAGAVLVACGLALGPLAASVIAWSADERPRFFARWGFSHAALVVLVGLAAWPFAGAIVGAVLPDHSRGALGGVLTSVLVTGIASLAAAAVARRLSPEGVGALGFPRHADFPVWRGLVGAVLAYACFLPAVVGLERVSPALLEAVGVSPPQAGLVEGILDLTGPPLYATVVLCVVVGPFLEEVLFRGFLQPLLVQNFSEKGGIALTAALFAFLHPVHTFLPLFALAALLGVLKVRTQRLAAPILVHALNNALVLFVAFRFPEASELVQ
jgi:membrane protease YdiL (CAAX protease family)